MPELAVNAYDRSGNPVILPPGLVLQVLRIGAIAQGGYDSCDIDAQGPELTLHALRSWLRYRIEIIGAAGVVWEGHVDAIDLHLGGVTVSLSTESMFNAVKVLYSYTGGDGASETAETDWLTDVQSVNTYGRKEAQHSSGGETTKEAAEAMRATVLAGASKASAPSIAVEGTGTELSASLYCSGRYKDLAWRYHFDDVGHEEHEEIDLRALLGWTYTNTAFGFIAHHYNRLIDWAGNLKALEGGDQLLISGTFGAANDGVRVVKDAVQGDPATYTASTIGFDPMDDVLDSAAGLGVLRAREALKITGTTGALNDGYYFISDTAKDDRVEVSIYGNAPVDTQAAGASVTLLLGHSVEFTDPVVLESVNVGETVTLTAYGQKIAMRFEVSDAPWDLGEIAIHIAKMGTPTDAVTVALYSDNGSDQPNALLASGTIAAVDIPSKEPGWKTAKMGTPYTLANATKYHIVVSRAGASNADNYYVVSLDSEGTYEHGDLRLWDGSAWHARATTAHMAFKVWAVLDTTVKIKQIVAAAVGATVVGTYAQTLAGVRTRKIRDGRATAWEEIQQLLDTGNSAGARMLCHVTPAGTLVLDYEQAYDAQTALIWTRDGRLRQVNGRYLLPGQLPVGRWVQVESLLNAEWQADTTRFLVDSAEYDAQGNKWTLRPPQAKDPFDVGTEQG